MRKRTIEIGRSALPDQPRHRFNVFIDDVLVGEIDSESGESVALPLKLWSHMRLVPVTR